MTSSTAATFTADDLADPMAMILRPDVHIDPYPWFDYLRSAAPIAEGVPGSDMWFITSHQLATDVFNNSAQTSTEVKSTPGHPLPDDLWMQYYDSELLFTDGERHSFLRKFANAAFKPRRVRKLRPQLEADVNRLIDRVADSGKIDITQDLAHPFAIETVMRMIGMPEESVDEVDRWSTAMGAMLDPSKGPDPAYRDPAIQAFGECIDYVEFLLKERAANPQDDVLSDFVSTIDQEGVLTHKDIMGIVIRGMINAGHTTTTSQMGNNMLALVQFPQQMQKLVEQPELMPQAVEELFRFDPAIQGTFRRAAEPIEVGGKTVETDQVMWLFGGAANRDPEAFENPNEIDIERDNSRSLTSGGGEHYCLGAVLARLEADVALSATLDRLKNLELLVPMEELERDPNITVRCATSIPMSFELR